MTDSGAAESFVVLAALGRPHGINGELRAKAFSDSDLLFESGALELRLIDGQRRAVVIRGAHTGGKGVLVLRLEGVETREQAEALRGAEIGLDRSQLPALDEDEFYLRDLPGMPVVDASGRELGTVSEVISYPTVDCAVMRGTAGRVEIPLVAPWLLDVDLEERRLVVSDLTDLVADNGSK